MPIRGNELASGDALRIRARRARAARKYKPDRVRLLLVAESPPAAADRYFYFENVPTHDSLFRHVANEILGLDVTRDGKPRLLAALRDEGVFLIDLMPDPLTDLPLAVGVPGLVRRVKRLSPEKVVLIKTTVYDAAFAPLRAGGVPVVDVRIPFPGSGQQLRFREAFARAVTTPP